MRSDDHAVYEEMVGDQLLADLAEYQRQTNTASPASTTGPAR